jgi:hypothetical protein
MAKRRFALAAAFSGGLLLAACTATPVYPLLTPIQVAKNFGYFEQPTDDTHWMVSYVTPTQAGYGFRFDQSPAEAQAKALALDMALWHASQIAQSHGYAGFSVTDRRTSVDAVNVTDYWSDPYWSGGFGFHHHRFWGGWGGWGGPLGGPGWDEPPQSSVQVEAKLTITLVKAPKGEDYRTDDTINRLRIAYPGAESVPAGAAAPPPPPPPPSAAKPTA